MTHIITVFNSTQNNFQPVVVEDIPVSSPEDLVWETGGLGTTLAGVQGTIFPNILSDQINPGYWYHGGNPPIPEGTIQVHSKESLTATNETIDVVSDVIQKGIFELRTLSPLTVNLISGSVPAQIDTTTNHNFSVGDYVEIKAPGNNLTIIPNGIYKVLSIVSPTKFTINNSSYVVSGQFELTTVNLFNYFWDEVYTTPLGLYQAKDESVDTPPFYNFLFTANNSDELKIFIDDPNIIPKVNDSLIIQRFFSSENSFTNASTTDGYNNVLNYPETETYEFKIKTVSSVVNPLSLANPYKEYTLVLDKSFAPILDEYYMFTLLNRKGTTTDRELFTDTWKLTQVQRSQLLGDPYNFTGVTQPVGRKNFLYYKGAELLGVQSLLKGIISEKDSPFIVLDFADEIKDRIYNGEGEFEVHLPTLLIQGEGVCPILTNTGKTLTDTSGAGTYSALNLKYPTSTIERYGWVFYDLRIVVIDHPELATVMGYNANRNFTLPKPILPAVGNRVVRATPDSPILITNVSSAGAITITTIGTHNLIAGDRVHVEGVLGTVEANSTSTNNYWYANPISTSLDPLGLRTFDLYEDSLLSIPVIGVATYAGGGFIYSDRLPFEHFLTYRLKGPHYNSLPYSEVIPFNWQTNGALDDNGSLEVQFPSLTHLVDINKIEGFEATEFDIIIGKYIQSSLDPYRTDGITEIVIVDTVSLKNPFTGEQNTTHTSLITQSTYFTAVLNSEIGLSDLGNTKYDILNVDVNKIYNLTINSLPETLFTSEGEWTIGLVKYKSHATQYRLTFDVNIPASKWNGTQNPTFESGNILMGDKLITEIEFLIDDGSGNVTDSPYIYAKIAPPLKKNNINDISLKLGLDF